MTVLSINQVLQLVGDEIGTTLTALHAAMAHHSPHLIHLERNTKEGMPRHVVIIRSAEEETHILEIAEMRTVLPQVVLEVILVGERLQGQDSVHHLRGNEVEQWVILEADRRGVEEEEIVDGRRLAAVEARRVVACGMITTNISVSELEVILLWLLQHLVFLVVGF